MACSLKQIGTAIRERRRERGWSQEVLSGFSGLARSHLTAIENGDVAASVTTLGNIADALGLPLSELLRHAETLEKIGGVRPDDNSSE